MELQTLSEAVQLDLDAGGNVGCTNPNMNVSVHFVRDPIKRFNLPDLSKLVVKGPCVVVDQATGEEQIGGAPAVRAMHVVGIGLSRSSDVRSVCHKVMGWCKDLKFCGNPFLVVSILVPI